MEIFAIFFLLGAVVYLGIKMNTLEEQVSSLTQRLKGTALPRPSPAVSESKDGGDWSIPVPRPPEASALSRAEGSSPQNFSGQASVLHSPINANFEFQFGSQIFTIVGAVAVMMGVGFFLRFAFANNLITETGRVIIGLILATVLIGGGAFIRRTYATYGHILTGLGIGLYYLSLYGAYNYYHIVALPSAFFAMIVVTAVGVWLSVAYNAQPLAALAILGGFLTPFLLPSESNHPHALFLYIALLDIGVLAVSCWKRWRIFVATSYLATLLVYLAWYATFGPEVSVAIAYGYATVFFAIFLLLAVVQYILLEMSEDSGDLGLLVLNPTIYLFLSYVILKPLHEPWLPVLATTLAVIYLLLAYVFSWREKISKRFSDILTTVGFVFLVIAVPLQFHLQWITIGWAAQGLALTYLGYRLRAQHIRVLGFLVSSVSLLRFLTIDLDQQVVSAFFNAHVFTFAMLVPCFLLTSAIHWLHRHEIEGDESVLRTLLFAETFILFLWLPSSEIYAFHERFWLPVVWSLVALLAGIVGIGLRDTFLRIAAYGTLLVSFFYIVTGDDIMSVAAYAPIFNTRVLVTAVWIAAATVYALALRAAVAEIDEEERKVMPRVVGVAVIISCFWLLSVEIIDYYQNLQRLVKVNVAAAIQRYGYLMNATLSVGWLIYGTILLVVGIVRKSVVARLASTVLFVLTILKVFLYDTAYLTDFYRFVSFIALGFILLAVGFLYYRFQSRIVGFLRGEDSAPQG